MKKLVLLCTVVLLIALLTGCKAEQSLRELDKKLDAVEERIEDKGDALERSLERAVEPKVTEGKKTQTPATEPLTLSGIEAEDLVLEHAGLLVDQVTALRSSYEIDDGVPQYDVEFYFEGWEYEYEIHAETGTILSYHKDR